MTDTKTPGVSWETITPMFGARLREPKKPAKPSDHAITQAQKSYNGEEHDGETWHVLTHRFPSVEMAEAAADELKRAGSYTNPESTVTVVIDPQNSGDKRIVSWRAGGKRGRK